MTTCTPTRFFLERNSLLDTDIALVALEASVDAERITYQFSLHVTREDHDAAHAVGLARTALAKSRGRNSAAYRRGSDDERIDAEGALAELALFAMLDRSDARIAPLVDYRPAPTADIEFEGLTFDVKSVSKTRRNVALNARAHKVRPVSAYVLARIVEDDVIDVFSVAHSAVDAWELRPGASPFYLAPLPTVR
jgi:hypothetical protein